MNFVKTTTNKELGLGVGQIYMLGKVGEGNFSIMDVCRGKAYHAIYENLDYVLGLETGGVIHIYADANKEICHSFYRNPEDWENNIILEKGMRDETEIPDESMIAYLERVIGNGIATVGKDLPIPVSDRDIATFVVNEKVPYSFEASDLYLPATGEHSDKIRELLERIEFPNNVSMFTSKHDGNKYFKIQFSYSKYTYDDLEQKKSLADANPDMQENKNLEGQKATHNL